VIDDSFAIRTQLAIELRNMNIACEQAESGEQGLELLEKNTYHMIFLDIIMPGIDGYEVCKRIRQRPATRKTPIIMLSGKDTPLDEVKGILAGATTYLTKPVNSERLQQTISRIARWIAEFS
jgi:DNA-binding response OmpR family regulator